MQKKPKRMCVGCSEMKEKSELIRIVRTKEGQVSLDTVGKAMGRGAYICKNKDCFLKAQKNGRLSRHLNSPVPKETYQALEKEIEIYEG